MERIKALERLNGYGRRGGAGSQGGDGKHARMRGKWGKNDDRGEREEVGEEED